MTGNSVLAPNQLLAFPPDPARGRILYDCVKERLAESFHQIADASSPVSRFNEGRVAAFLHSISRAPKISPSLFAIYHEMLAAVDEDDVDRVSGLFVELVNQDLSDGPISLHNLIDEHLGQGNGARYKRWADVDPENRLNLIPLAPDEFRQIAATTRKAFALMDAGAPEVSSEIRSLLAEVVFANGAVGANLVFNGLSSFYLWGAVFLNAKAHTTTLKVVQTLAHESSHMHLFAAALDSPLVQNPYEHRFRSPLRSEPRPMDGIYHATYVTARMHYVLSRLHSSGVLAPALVEEADDCLARHVRAFREGYEVVSTHGKPTELGHDLLASCHAYMRAYL
jgi:hypothetical protein